MESVAAAKMAEQLHKMKYVQLSTEDFDYAVNFAHWRAGYTKERQTCVKYGHRWIVGPSWNK